MSVAFTSCLYVAEKVFGGKTGDQVGQLLQDPVSLAQLHFLCQAHNSFMQDKIGSGFDIQCAIYGS